MKFKEFDLLVVKMNCITSAINVNACNYRRKRCSDAKLSTMFHTKYKSKLCVL